MCTVRFIGCLHLGHRWMAKHRGFEESYLHDDWLYQQWNKVVHPRDLTYILGDVTMESSKEYPILSQLKGRKIVVLGNHDLPKHTRKLLDHVESVAGMVDYKGFALTHSPIHPDEMGMYRGNIHAHIHENQLQEFYARELYNDRPTLKPTLSKYVNVDAHLINYTPKTIDELWGNSLT